MADTKIRDNAEIIKKLTKTETVHSAPFVRLWLRKQPASLKWTI